MEHHMIGKQSEATVSANSAAIQQRKADVNAFIDALKDMTLNQYQEESRKTIPADPSILAFTLGVAGEAGEIAELVKKNQFHGKQYSPVDMLSELGDLLFYLSGVAVLHGFTLERVARFNIQKLRNRYPNGFVKGGGIRSNRDDAPSTGNDVPNGGANG